jgi:hypothetical protein
MTTEPWHTIDQDAAVLWREYEFGNNAFATTMVFRGIDGLVAVSPGKGMSASDFDALAAYGPVTALVANNAHHHLGQAEWRARFPKAVSYAPAGAAAALNKKATGITYRPLSELVLPVHAHCDEPPGYRTGDAFFRIRTAKGTVWYTGDLLTNIQRMPGPPVRWLFTLSGSAPGFRLFRIGAWAFVKDKKALKAWVLAHLASDPPAVIVPAHGPAYTQGDVAAQAKAQIEKL